MPLHPLILSGIFLALLSSCRKNTDPEPPQALHFEVIIQNDFDLLEAHYAVYLSDADGLVRAFRWLPAKDTATLSIPDVQAGDRFDCTIIKITTLQASGNPAPDSIVTLHTYTNLYSGAHIRLHDPNYLQTTDLHISFSGMTTLDSIVVPDGLTFARPQPGNNFKGEYRVFHSGRMWCRIRINGEASWRYIYFGQADKQNLDTTIIATDLPVLSSPAWSIDLPFLAAWDYQADHVFDAGLKQFLAIGGSIRIPGGAIPILNRLDIYEPPGLSGQGYRLRLTGSEGTPGGYTYSCDRFYNSWPTSAPEPQFDVSPTLLADKRLVAVQCSGLFDALCFTRAKAGSPSLLWEVFIAPSNTGFVTYRLPDVPEEIENLFPQLRSYDFDDGVRVRAEQYDQYSAYPEILARLLAADDPLWQPKAGYLAKERVF